MAQNNKKIGSDSSNNSEIPFEELKKKLELIIGNAKHPDTNDNLKAGLIALRVIETAYGLRGDDDNNNK